MKVKISSKLIHFLIIAFLVTIFSSIKTQAQSTEDGENLNLWVIDQCDVISEETIEYVNEINEQVFPNYYRKPQLCIVIIESLPYNKSIDSYKLELFNRLGIGTKEENSGMLFVMALEDRKYGLEIGDGFERNTLLRRDLETDFITNDMKNHLRNMEYDIVIQQVVEHLYTIVENDQLGVYDEKQELYEEYLLLKEQERIERLNHLSKTITKIAKLVMIGIIIIAVVLGTILLIYYIYASKKVKRCMNDYAKVVKIAEIGDKKSVSFIIDEVMSRKQGYKEPIILNVMYDRYIKNMEECFGEPHIDFIKGINSFDNFKAAFLYDKEEIRQRINLEIKRLHDIRINNIKKIKEFVAIRSVYIDTEAISLEELEERINDECDCNVPIEDSRIEEIYEKELKDMYFEAECEKFIKENPDKINSSFFKKNKFIREMKRSKEYEHYSYNNNQTMTWMTLYLASHIKSNEQSYKAAKAQQNSQSYTSSSRPSGGGGFSSGGGFSGGW